MHFSTISVLAALISAAAAAKQMQINYYNDNLCQNYIGQVDVTWATSIAKGKDNCYNYNYGKVTIGNSRYFYDSQIVAISKDSAKEDPYSTLKEAADEKRRKYQSLGSFFHPLIFSAGGLMLQEASQTYKKLQELLGPFAASQLDLPIGLALTKTRAISAASIARDLPRRTHS
ncbi:hypothetical protein BKA60DRAFT_666349 [Fusarium oxysporum]|nr:hypothetical protein BKA60DRAFT_666349 [Fusarium oxysporum]